VSTASVKRAWRVRDGCAAPLPPLQTALGPDAALRFAAAGPFHARFAPLVEKFTRRRPANVPMGSAGLKAALLADGNAEVYASPFRGMHLWDVAAGHALLNALGGRLTALDNSAVAYSGDLVLRKGVFFSGPAVDDQLRTEICDMYSYISGKA
jgi:3'-phosphoadenosine 5'-phosphosulfate (PAPS) 3'-phosphatase